MFSLAPCSTMKRYSILIGFVTALVAGGFASSGVAGTSSASKCRALLVKISGEDREIRPPINQALFSKVLLQETNYQRCVNGRASLTNTKAFEPMARTHSNWMASHNKLSHVSNNPGWETLGRRLRRIRVKYRLGLENLAVIHHPSVESNEPFYTRNPANKCEYTRADRSLVAPHSYRTLARMSVSLLMQSSGHRKNILNKKVTHHTAATRMNVKDTPCGRHFITQNFVQKARH